MGLDMYLMSKKPDSDSDTGKEIHYWRKHHDLHGWMEVYYRTQGGTDESFNCVDVPLDLAALNKLENAVKYNLLPATEGFFFGNNPPDDESIKGDLLAIERAREAISDGLIVYYSSWW